jgi:hypothetical protein
MQRLHAWFEMEQETVKHFVLGDQMNGLLPLSLTKEHPQQYSQMQMMNFKSRGSYRRERPLDRGQWLIKHGFIKAR